MRLPGRMSVVAAAGSYPADLAQRFPGGTFATLGIRLGGLRGSSSPVGGGDVTRRRVEPEREPEELEARAGGMMAFEARPAAASGQALLRVRAPSAHFVEVYGSFSNWQPVALKQERDGWWSVALPVERGTHEVNVRIDGGSWLVPPGTTTVHDEFGGTSGVLVVDW